MRGAARRAVAVLAILAASASVSGQVVDFGLDGSLDGKVDGKTVRARLGPGAEFVESVEGQGVEPSRAAPGVIVPVPDPLWKPAGTLEFRLRPSRTIRFHADTLSSSIVKCPLFELTLIEDPLHTVLRANMATAGAPATGAERRALAAATRGNLFWSHLKGGQWYHVAFAWDAANGRMDTYLNGAIQQEMRLRRRWPPWTPPDGPSGPLEVGGVLGRGDDEARLAVDSIRLHSDFMDERQVAALLKDRPNFPLTGEGRWDYPTQLDLSPYTLTPVYETEFEGDLNWIREDDLFEGERRVRLPEGKDWILEGAGEVFSRDGKCVVRSADEERPDHLVLWSAREFPADFLLEFAIEPLDPNIGLTIVFFATRNIEGGSPFDPNAPKRAGVFRNYYDGFLNGYHTSYFATNPDGGGVLRRTTNLRKNKGFFMPAAGIDRIGGAGPGPHTVRLLKVGGAIRLETRGRMALVYDDDGETYGPAWTHAGWIGLRQMGHSRQVSYTHFKVWRVEPKP